MTATESACIHCGHRESDQIIIHDDEQGDVEYCQPCGPGHGVHPFEAAPPNPLRDNADFMAGTERGRQDAIAGRVRPIREAAPSTDEGEARLLDELWDAYNEAQAFYLNSSLSNHNVREAIRDSKREAIEAAIRAPLDAELEASRRYARELSAMIPHETVIHASLEEENTRLREAIIWMSGSSEFGPGQPAHEHWVEIRDTLLRPPSSTEGTKEVEG